MEVIEAKWFDGMAGDVARCRTSSKMPLSTYRSCPFLTDEAFSLGHTAGPRRWEYIA
jgi:hypothetical protein